MVGRLRGPPLSQRGQSDVWRLQCPPWPGRLGVASMGASVTVLGAVRRDRTVAGRRPVSPEEPASWTDRRWTSPCVCLRWLPV